MSEGQKERAVDVMLQKIDSVKKVSGKFYQSIENFTRVQTEASLDDIRSEFEAMQACLS